MVFCDWNKKRNWTAIQFLSQFHIWQFRWIRQNPLVLVFGKATTAMADCTTLCNHYKAHIGRMSTASTVEFYRGFFMSWLPTAVIEKCNRPVGTTGVPKGLGGNLVWLTICDVCSGQVGNVIAHERWELNRTRPKDAIKVQACFLGLDSALTRKPKMQLYTTCNRVKNYYEKL